MSRAQCTDAHARGTTPACHLGPLFLPWGPRADLVCLSPWPGTAWHRDRTLDKRCLNLQVAFAEMETEMESLFSNTWNFISLWS